MITRSFLSLILSFNLFFISLQHCYAEVATTPIATITAEEKLENDKVAVDEDQAISGVMMAESIIALLTSFVAGFIGMLVAIGCRMSCYRVPSVVIYLGGAIGYLLEEIVLYATFMGLSEKIKKAKEELKIKQGEDYNEQIEVLKEQRDILYAVFSLETSKGLVLNALNVTFTAATVLALAEAIVLKVAEKVYAGTKAEVEADSVVQDELAGSMTANELTVEGGALNDEAAVVMTESTESGAIQDAKEAGPQCNDSTAEGQDSFVETQQDVQSEINADNEVVSAAEEAEAIADIAAGDKVTAVEAEALIVESDAQGVASTASMQAYTKESKILIQIRKSTLLFCPNLEKVEQLGGADPSCTTASCNLIKTIIPEAKADSSSSATSFMGFVEALKLIGVTGGIVLGAALGIKKIKVTSADSTLYHPITRAIFITVINVLVGMASAFSYTAAGISLKRALLIQKIIDRLQQLKSNLKQGTVVTQTNPTTLVPSQNGVNANLSELQIVEQQKEEKMNYEQRTKVSSCTGSNMRFDPTCKCKEKDECFRNPAEVDELKTDLPPFTNKDLDPNILQSINSGMNQLTRNLANNNQKQADKMASEVIKHSAYLENKKNEMLRHLKNIPDGARWLDMYESSLKSFKIELKKMAKEYSKDKSFLQQFSLFKSIEENHPHQNEKGKILDSNLSVEEKKQLKHPIRQAIGMELINLEDPFDKLLEEKNKSLKIEGSDLDRISFSQMKKSQMDSVLDSSKHDINVGSNHSIFKIISKRYQKNFHKMEK